MPRENASEERVIAFPIEKVLELRRRAEDACQVSEEGAQGWSKSELDPMRLLEAFPALRIKNGFILRAYQFRAGSDGNGLVWAMPADAAFPEPEDCPLSKDDAQKSPRPPGALDDVMEVIEGDGSPWSYLCASILSREIEEFGAVWHGCNWSMHVILGSDPWLSAEEFAQREPTAGPYGDPNGWQWLEEKPDEWKPAVSMGKHKVTVSFYTYSGLVNQAIFRHLDTYAQGLYRAKSEIKKIAEGPRGYVI